ncbi:MAG TPA: FG-GAP-like repeat-containing protein, partial [Gemmataceae bacterium]|nr:FG-GAP-like repeat-containing protein [Gemmataceae bacterium]
MLRSRPRLEALEERLAPAVPPKILSFTPANGSTVGSTAANPTLSITFSEAMDPVDAQNTANYSLFNSEGQPVSINAATYVAKTDTVTLSYNGNAILPADTYSLYVRGDVMFEATDTYTLANPGQIVVANTGDNTVSTLNASTDPATTELNSAQSYPATAPTGIAAVATPVSVIVGDFNNDGFKDVALLNSGTNEIDIYLGQASEIYNFSPSDRIGLPAGAKPVAMVSADFVGDGLPSLAVLSSTGQIYVYNNISTGGVLSFEPVGTYNIGVAPTSMAVGDFNGDGIPDLIVADPTAVGAAPTFHYYVYILKGVGIGAFNGVIQIQVGTEHVLTSLQAPNLIAGGYLGILPTSNPPPAPDSDSFVVGGANGLEEFISTADGNYGFDDPNPPQTGTLGLFGPDAQPTALTIAQIDPPAGGFGLQAEDVVVGFPATTTPNPKAPPTIRIYQAESFFPETTIDLGATETVTDIIGADVNRDNRIDLLFTTKGGPDLGTNGSDVGVLINTSSAVTGTVSFAPEVDYGVDYGPISLGFGPAEGDHNPYIVTANFHTNTVLNEQLGSFTVLRGTVFPATNGTFIQSTTLSDPTSQGPSSIAVGDVNGDGISDIVVANLKTNTVSVFLGLAGGGYGAATTYSTLDASGIGAGPVSVILADLTGNGLLDVVTADSEDNAVSVLMNNGAGGFAQAVTYKTGVNPTQVVAANFNPDGTGGGHIDLAVAHNGSGAQANARGVTILLGNGDGTFQNGYEILSN